MVNQQVIDNLGQLTLLLSHPRTPPAWPAMKRVLMVSPEHFRVDYAINPYMKTETGELQKVDSEKAQQQWAALRDAYQRMGFTVETLAADAACPDMVFAANQSFPFWNADGKPAVLMSRMQSPHRKPEVDHFRRWFRSHGYAVRELSDLGVHDETLTFEGNGDLIPHPGHGLLWGGVGPRTAREVYEGIALETKMPVIRLPLQLPEFYHLDTCFSILSDDTVAVQPRAFSTLEMRMIHEVFDHVIDIEYEEALHCFAGNCHSPDGRHVLLHPGARKFVRDLEKKNFNVVEIDTSEFLKSGGSVFCMKVMLF